MSDTLDYPLESIPFRWARDELSKTQLEIKQGDKSKDVMKVQEWLCFHGIHTQLDSEFGPATHQAVCRFQTMKNLGVDGVVGNQTWRELTKPMIKVLAPFSRLETTLGRQITMVAQRHLEVHPIEIGGDNQGPWVRLYMQGHDGKEYLWCAGFVSFILKQASDALGIAPVIPGHVSCDKLAEQAKNAGIFISEEALFQNTPASRIIQPGYVFLRKKTNTDWVHTGIVVAAQNETFESIEGNTNNDGSRNGYEVCRHIKTYKHNDYIQL